MAAHNVSTTSSIPAIIERFSLSPPDDPSSTNGPRLSTFLIRLTDASLTSINKAVAGAKSLDQSSTSSQNRFELGYVELLQKSSGNDGILSFGGVGDEILEHRFTMLDAQRDLGPSGHLETVAQLPWTTMKNGGGGKIEKVGKMQPIGAITNRLQISATTQDTFETTRKRAQEAEQEIRKNAAKVLKGPTTARGGRNKVLEKITKIASHTQLQRPLTPLSSTNQHRSQSPSTNVGIVRSKTIGNAQQQHPTSSSDKSPVVNHRLSINQKQTPQQSSPIARAAAAAAANQEEEESGAQRVKAKSAMRAPAPKSKQQPQAIVVNNNHSDATSTAAHPSVSPTTEAMNGVREVRLDPPTSHHRTSHQPPAAKRMAMDTTSRTDSSVDGQQRKFESQYPTIDSVDVRNRYKGEFDQDYASYMSAYEKLRQLATTFEALGSSLKSTPRTSPDERREIEKNIMDKYKRDFENEEITQLTKRHAELKAKLHVIKMRVKEYDEKNTGQGGSG